MLKVALRMLLDQPSKSLGTFFGVVVSAFLMAQQMSTFLGILGRVSAFATSSDVDVWVTSANTEDTDITGTVPSSWVARAASTEGVAFAAPLVQGLSRATRPDGAQELVKLVGVELPRALGLTRTLVGTSRDALAGPGRVLLNEEDRPLYGGIVPGERIEIGGRTSVVAGFFAGVEPHASYAYVFTPLAHAQSVLGLPRDRVTFVLVRVARGVDANVVATRLRARIPEARTFTTDALAHAEASHFMERTPVGVVFGMGTVVAALVGMLIVGLTMFSSVVDRTREFGTLLALGATRADLFAVIVGQALAFFASGTSVGLALFGVVKMHATSAPMLAPAPMLVLVAAISLVTCVVASLAAVRRVLAIDPAIVFKG